MSIIENLVSIITPCYNGEQYISRFLNSVLRQQYRPLELVLVNDGSTDQTEAIIKSFISDFDKMNITLKYIYQENGGQSKAINAGLKVCKGEFITWPDSDDILDDKNIENKVMFLKKNLQYDMVMCKTKCVMEKDLEKTVCLLERKKPYDGNLFEDFLFVNNVYFAPGSFMVRSKQLFTALKGTEIIESDVGQNWQILLPMSYYFKCGFIDDILYTYVIRQNSHSRNDKSVEATLEKFDHQILLLKQILENLIPNQDVQYHYLERLNRLYSQRRLELFFRNHERESFNKEFRNHYQCCKSLKTIFKLVIINNPIAFKLYSSLRRNSDVFS